MTILDGLILTAAFTIATLATMLVCQAVQQRLAVGRRLVEKRPSVVTRGDALLKKVMTHPFLTWIERSSSLSNTKERTKLARDLAYAGFEHPSAPVWYVIARFGLAIGLPLLFILAQHVLAKPVTGSRLIIYSLVLCTAGLLGPRLFIRRRATERRQRLENEFPDALDLLVVCVESGLGLESAFLRVGAEIAKSHPFIADEFARLSQQLRAGRSRGDALRTLGERSESAPIRSFVALLIQTDSLGTSVGQSLRVYSKEMRETRLLIAEEKALRIPVLLTVPLVACILPVIITALLLPAIIDVVHTLFPILLHRQVH
jgi:tight adherence protein C